MKYLYKITKANEWKNCNSILIILFVYIVAGGIIFYYKSPEENFWDYYLFWLIGSLLFIIPLSVLHLKYYSINEGMEMIYDESERSIIIKNNKNKTANEFTLDDIKCVFHTMTLPMAEKRMHWFPWDSYNYSEIYLNNGKKHIITSLMVYKLELPVGDKYEVITSFYPYPRG